MRGNSSGQPRCAAAPALASALLLLVAATGSASSPPESGRPMPAAPAIVVPESLTVLNDAFRRAYADAKRRVLAGAGPLIVVKGDTAVLIRDGQRAEANVNVPFYHSLKTIAHIPLAIYVVLTPGEGPIDADRLETLESLRQRIPPARASLAGPGFPAPLLARQEGIVAESLAFLDEVRARREFRRDRLESFTRQVAPLVAANVRDATRAQLDALHAQVSAWRRELRPAEWDRLHVVIIGPHMPRDGEVTTQYFSRLLREPAEGRRIIYAESLWDEPRALDLLATHLLDGGVGEAFFGDFMRMHRDLLADDARDYLPRLLPE